MTTHLDLRIIADTLGIALTHHEGDPPGYYDHRARKISTQRGLTVAKYRTVLAHELGHAIYCDQATGHPHYDQRQETRADRFAARILIPADQWNTAKRWCGGNVAEMAAELEVSPRLVEIYAKHIEKKTK